jgi:DNA-binding NtrC family response regulator
MDGEQRAILVVGPDVGQRWELAWALHEAGIVAEQAGTGEQALRRIVHGRLAGVVLDGLAPRDMVDELVQEIHPDPETGEVPFVLVTSGRPDAESVVARVRVLLQPEMEPG